MANIKRPEGMEIAALREKKIEYFDLMTPGSGTPWEERGNGMVAAFFKTLKMSMFSPVQLTHQIRRPETMTDVRGFMIVCSIFWAASWAIHSGIHYYRTTSQPNWEGDPPTYFMGVALKFVVGTVVPFILLNVYTTLYFKLVSTELKNKAPMTLLKNVKAYCLGPSVLSLIPYAGPLLAIVWLAINFCAVGTRRLRISTSGAVIGTILAMAATIALGVGIVYGAGWLIETATGGGLHHVEPRKSIYGPA